MNSSAPFFLLLLILSSSAKEIFFWSYNIVSKMTKADKNPILSPFLGQFRSIFRNVEMAIDLLKKRPL